MNTANLGKHLCCFQCIVNIKPLSFNTRNHRFLFPIDGRVLILSVLSVSIFFYIVGTSKTASVHY